MFNIYVSYIFIHKPYKPYNVWRVCITFYSYARMKVYMGIYVQWSMGVKASRTVYIQDKTSWEGCEFTYTGVFDSEAWAIIIISQ